MKCGQKAWLLTWEWSGAHAAVEDQIAAILRPRWSQERVGAIVECLYALHQYTPSELACYSKRPKKNPYKAQWQNGHCFCGHNPSLHANYVHDLIIKQDLESGLDIIKWVMPRSYKFNVKANKSEEMRGPIAKSVKRTISGPLSGQEIGRYKDSQKFSGRVQVSD